VALLQESKHTQSSKTPVFNLSRIDLSRLSIPQGTLVARDFNAYGHTYLLTQSSDSRGQLFSEQLKEMLVLNYPSSSTRLPIDGHPSSPDVFFCSPDLVVGARYEACHWTVFIKMKDILLSIR